ncbi:ATP-binding protein [Lacticaseibacillus paracasei]|uniref:ATP-binding protein n=1 Tax=Lacticaseibacillus paracasei TaxID=1597 RepID=UPI000FF2F100|nr:ATP-binding protein [Lacticaseibacillus paracasei]RND45717.1 Divergent AAA domain protein [Lacticaseibacillus paracasei]UVD34075.1 ATP-binding protein [Lacticaseibacillus paracasei]
MNVEELYMWLQKPEDDHHDFKAQWYDDNHKEEFVKDIFSFVNVTHHDDCFLIIGVDDKTHDVIGVEDDKYRRNQQNIIDFLHMLPISGEYIPRVQVETVQYFNGHDVDVIRIFNTNNVPVFLNERWNARGKKTTENSVEMGYIYTRQDIHPEQIFLREGDVNTARNQTGEFHQVEELWKKHFHLNQPILDRYLYCLQDTQNWSYFENDKIGFLYNLNPDFYMLLKDDDATAEVESFSINFSNPKIDWQVLSLKYRQITVKSMQAAFLDSANLLFVVPDVGTPRNSFDRIFYRNFTVNTLKNQVQNLFAVNGPNEVSKGDLIEFYKNIVVYESEEERKDTEIQLAKYGEMLTNAIKPSEEDLQKLKSHLSTRLPKGSVELSKSALTSTLMQSNAGIIIKRILAEHQTSGSWLDPISDWPK